MRQRAASRGAPWDFETSVRRIVADFSTKIRCREVVHASRLRCCTWTAHVSTDVCFVSPQTGCTISHKTARENGSVHTSPQVNCLFFHSVQILGRCIIAQQNLASHFLASVEKPLGIPESGDSRNVMCVGQAKCPCNFVLSRSYLVQFQGYDSHQSRMLLFPLSLPFSLVLSSLSLQHRFQSIDFCELKVFFGPIWALLFNKFRGPF